MGHFRTSLIAMTVLGLGTMDCEGCLMVALIPVGIVAGLIALAASASGRRKNLEVVANRLGGTLQPGSIDGDRVEFKIDRIPATLSCYPGSRYQSPFTRLQCDYAPRGFLRVVPEGILSTIRKAFGAQDIQIGDTHFDDQFIIQGSPEAWVTGILDPETRRRILLLTSFGQSLLAGSAFSLEAGPSGVTITCGRNLGDDMPKLQSFLDNALALHGRVLGRSSDGIQVLSGESHASRGTCPVCANSLDSNVQRCPTCATPHHSDCWQYFGGCAIYGCTSRGGPKA